MQPKTNRGPRRRGEIRCLAQASSTRNPTTHDVPPTSKPCTYDRLGGGGGDGRPRNRNVPCRRLFNTRNSTLQSTCVCCARHRIYDCCPRLSTITEHPGLTIFDCNACTWQTTRTDGKPLLYTLDGWALAHVQAKARGFSRAQRCKRGVRWLSARNHWQHLEALVARA